MSRVFTIDDRELKFEEPAHKLVDSAKRDGGLWTENYEKDWWIPYHAIVLIADE